MRTKADGQTTILLVCEQGLSQSNLRRAMALVANVPLPHCTNLIFAIGLVIPQPGIRQPLFRLQRHDISLPASMQLFLRRILPGPTVSIEP